MFIEFQTAGHTYFIENSSLIEKKNINSMEYSIASGNDSCNQNKQQHGTWNVPTATQTTAYNTIPMVFLDSSITAGHVHCVVTNIKTNF